MISVGMSTCCVYHQSTEDAFRLASVAGFDGIHLGHGALIADAVWQAPVL